MVLITVGTALCERKKKFSLRMAHIDDRRVLIPHMLKCRKRYMASLIHDDLLGLDTGYKCLRRGHDGAVHLQVDSVYQNLIQAHN